MPRKVENRPILTVDEIAVHMGELLVAARALEAAKAVHQKVLDAKAADGIVLTEAAKWVKKLLKQVPGSEIRAAMELSSLYAAASGYDVAEAPDLFSGMADGVRDAAIWREKGRIAARAGGKDVLTPPTDCPAGECTQAYLEGVHDVSKAAGAKIKPTRKEEAAAKAAALADTGKDPEIEAQRQADAKSFDEPKKFSRPRVVAGAEASPTVQ